MTSESSNHESVYYSAKEFQSTIAGSSIQGSVHESANGSNEESKPSETTMFLGRDVDGDRQATNSEPPNGQIFSGSGREEPGSKKSPAAKAQATGSPWGPKHKQRNTARGKGPGSRRK